MNIEKGVLKLLSSNISPGEGGWEGFQILFYCERSKRYVEFGI